MHLTSDLSPKGEVIIYETGDQSFERTTPTLAEVLSDAEIRRDEDRDCTTADYSAANHRALTRLVGDMGYR